MTDVRGIDRAKRRIAAIPVAIKDRMAGTVQRKANRARDLTLSMIPRDSGELASTVRVEKRGEFSASVLEGNSQVPHAAATEFGWNNNGTQMPPQPHFFPANRVAKEEFKKEMRSNARKAFKDITGK